jgi:hypothetical protein
MRDISVTLPAGNPPFAWQAVNAVTTYGQHTEIVSNNISGQGEVDLWLISQAVVPGVGTNAGPALTGSGRGLYMAWWGAGNDQGIWWTTYTASGGWNQNPQQNKVPGVGTSASPSLAVLNGRLYMLWKGAGSDQSLWWSSTDGVSPWAPQKAIPGVGSSTGPGLSVFQGRLFAAWTGAGKTHKVIQYSEDCVPP